MRLGSLCTGIGGLDLAVEEVFGAELAWCAEIDPKASQVLDARWPGVPNLGDFRGVDVEPVDVLCAGFPCQPVSSAGRRRGVEDERWLFDDIVELVGRMGARPGLLVFENVRGLLTANGGRAMGRVVHGLASLGYVGRYGTVRASDVGAPHRRERVFIVASDADRARSQGPQPAQRHDLSAGSGGDVADADGARAGRERGAVPGAPVVPRREDVDVHAAVDAGPNAPHPDGETRPGERRICASEAIHEPGAIERSGRRDRVAWGDFAEAVERWELALGRCAPDPTDERGRLSPVFVEWMMGFPTGWVTDVLDVRTHALRCLGNAVVPQQAAHALRVLTGVVSC